MCEGMRWTLVTIFAGLGILSAAEQPLSIELVSQTKSIQPGTPFYVALALHHAPGYHTYWKYPGIVGVPTNIRWKGLPRGIKAGEIEWPEPERTHMFQIKAQGYERDVVLPILMTPSRSLKVGTQITLTGTASWMCCAKQCNPGFQELSLTLPVSSDAPEMDDNWNAKIQKELRLRVEESAAWTSEALVSEKQVTITMTPGPQARAISATEARKLIYFTEDGIVDSDQPQEILVNSDGSVTLRLIQADVIPGGMKSVVQGVLVRQGGWVNDRSVRAIRLRSKVNR